MRVSDENYSRLRRVFEIIWSHQSKFYPVKVVENANPVHFLAQCESKSNALAKRALRNGLLDLIASLTDCSQKVIRGIDSDLEQENLPNTRVLSGFIGNTAAKVLKRGKIRTLEEFYVVKELVADSASGLTGKERKLLEKHLFTFEQTQ